MVSDGNLRKHQGSSSKDGLPLRRLIDLSEEGRKDFLDRLYSNLWNLHIPAIYRSSFLPPRCWPTTLDKNLIDSPCSLKFSYLFFNNFIMIFKWAPRWLLSRSDGGGWRSGDGKWNQDQFQGHRKRPRKIRQHCLGGILLVPVFRREAIIPQLEKISLDQCRLSLFPNLCSLPPRLALPLMKPKLLIAMRVSQQSSRVQFRVCARWPPPCIV